jgi:hypothetical protein
MIRKLYTEERKVETEHENPADIKDRLSKFKPFVYGLREYVLMLLINFFTCWGMCSCCEKEYIDRRRERYFKYQKAKVKLAEEFDLLELMKRVRVLSMLTSEIFA